MGYRGSLAGSQSQSGFRRLLESLCAGVQFIAFSMCSPFPLVTALRQGFCLVPVATHSPALPCAWLSRATQYSPSQQCCRSFSHRKGHGACHLATWSPETPGPGMLLSQTPNLASKGKEKGASFYMPSIYKFCPQILRTANAS